MCIELDLFVSSSKIIIYAGNERESELARASSRLLDRACLFECACLSLLIRGDLFELARSRGLV